jgi:hypothetical protein
MNSKIRWIAVAFTATVIPAGLHAQSPTRLADGLREIRSVAQVTFATDTRSQAFRRAIAREVQQVQTAPAPPQKATTPKQNWLSRHKKGVVWTAVAVTLACIIIPALIAQGD